MRQIDELLLKLMVTLARDRRAIQGRVRSVGFMREYLSLPDDLGVHTLTSMSEQAIVDLAQSVSIKPKSDVAHFHFYLNDVRYRLLQAEKKQATIVNAISRQQWLAYEKLAEAQPLLLDHLLEEDAYFNLANVDYDQVSRLLHYMLFIGSDKGPSMHQAEGIFIFEEALNMNSWTIMTKEQAISYIIEHGIIEVMSIDNELKLAISFTIQ